MELRSKFVIEPLYEVDENMSINPQMVTWFAQILTSLGALVGVVITVIVTHRNTVRTLTAEIRKVRYGVLNVYAERLCEARLLAYSEIYPLLSNTVKMIDYPELFTQSEDIEHLENQLNVWDSKHGLLLTKESGNHAMKTRSTLRSLRKQGYKTIHNCGQDRSAMKELCDALVGLEVALRVDLGIYAVESWNIETGFGAYTDREMPSNRHSPPLQGG